MDVISSLTNAISIATRLREISKNISEAEFKNLLADLSLELADAKLEMVSLKEEIAGLKQKLLETDRARPKTSKNQLYSGDAISLRAKRAYSALAVMIPKALRARLTAYLHDFVLVQSVRQL